MEERSSFSGERLKLARELCGFSQTELAKKVVTQPQLISMLEKSKRKPDELLLASLAETLHVQEEFFRARTLDTFHEEECHFRSLRSAPKRLKQTVLASGTMLGILIAYLAPKLPDMWPSYDVPELSGVSDVQAIEEAALYCREHWGLGGDTSISNMIRVLESLAGVVVTRFSLEQISGKKARKVDAFSRTGPTKVVVLNSDKQSTVRSRFDCAHELGHLVMHSGKATGDRKTEGEANRFASAFLMPADAFEADFRSLHPMSWEKIWDLKQDWRVSAAAIVRRAYDLELIGPTEYRRAYKYMSAKGWLHGKVEEPVSIAPERPELLSLALKELETRTGETPLDIADSLGWTSEMMSRITGADLSGYQRLAGVESIAKWRAKRS